MDYFVWIDHIAPKIIRDQSSGRDAITRFVARTIKPDFSARYAGGSITVVPKKFTPIPKVRGWESPYGWPKSP